MTRMQRMILLLFLIGGSLVLVFTLGSGSGGGTSSTGRPPHHGENSFRNPFPGFQTRGGRDFLRWQWDRMRGKTPSKPERYDFPVAANDGTVLRDHDAGMRVTWIGHATTLVQFEGTNILTDPIFSERASPVSFAGPRRHVPPVPAFENLPRIDVVLISHNHYDHLDKETIKRLGNGPRYFVPLLLGKFLLGLGISSRNIVELDWGQSAEYRGLVFHCTPAQHFSGRGLHDTNQTLWCGWAVVGAQQRFYFAGDTGYFPGFRDLRAQFGQFDLAMLPIGAYLPRWFMAPVHMDPAQAVQAFLDLEARHFLGIHWGTFELADEPLDQPPRDLRAAADSLEVAPERVWVFQHGETRLVP